MSAYGAYTLSGVWTLTLTQIKKLVFEADFRKANEMDRLLRGIRCAYYDEKGTAFEDFIRRLYPKSQSKKSK